MNQLFQLFRQHGDFAINLNCLVANPSAIDKPVKHLVGNGLLRDSWMCSSETPTILLEYETLGMSRYSEVCRDFSLPINQPTEKL